MTRADHRCGYGPLCRAFEVVEGRRVAAPITHATGLCDACRDWTQRSSRLLPHDWCKLKVTIGESRAPVSDKTRRPKPGPKVPLNVTNDALMRDMVDTANEAAEVVAAAMNVTWTRTGHTKTGWSTSSWQDYRLLHRAVRLITGRVDKLLEAPEGVDIARRLVMLHRSTVRHLGETAQRERQHLPCPSCGANALVKEVQDRRGHESVAGVETPEVIHCMACEGTWTESEYQWLSTMVLSEREEHDVLKWLLEEAKWQRDVAAWLAAEREWILFTIADTAGLVKALGVDNSADLITRLRAA